MTKTELFTPKDYSIDKSILALNTFAAGLGTYELFSHTISKEYIGAFLFSVIVVDAFMVYARFNRNKRRQVEEDSILNLEQ